MLEKKIKGQYMSPERIVDMVLDNIDYKGEQILSKKIMEPSFGDGAFLVNIVERIMEEGKKEGLSIDETKNLLYNLVYGIEKDFDLYCAAVKRLNALLQGYGIKEFDWSKNLIYGDALEKYSRFVNEMDYVAGNPPYIRIHHLTEGYREMVRGFHFADGIFDIYIIFYEIGMLMLNESGRLGYISPNSFLKNISQQKFRDYLIENMYISKIYDFKNSKIFGDADSYSCVCTLDKNKNRENKSIEYMEFSMYEPKVQKLMDYGYFKKKFQNKVWNLGADEDMEFIDKNRGFQNRISDIAIVQNGIVTNKDSVYIVHAFTDKELKEPYFGKHTDELRKVYFVDKRGKTRQIESTILHRCIKASRYTGIIDNTYIIFPYMENSDGGNQENKTNTIHDEYKQLTEEKLKNNFPNAYAYLSDYRNELESRSMDKNAFWFLFGRKQGIYNSNRQKIVLRRIVRKNQACIDHFVVEKDVAVYSGMYIIAKEDSNDNLKTILDILSSDYYSRYCSTVGKDIAGGYVCISTKMIENFGFSSSCI